MSELVALAHRLVEGLERIAAALENPPRTATQPASYDRGQAVSMEVGAKRLGISAETLRRLCAKGEIPSRTFGKNGTVRRVTLGALDDYMAKGERLTR